VYEPPTGGSGAEEDDVYAPDDSEDLLQDMLDGAPHRSPAHGQWSTPTPRLTGSAQPTLS
jgi:hypothetical protein